jgi:dienelactone hydrolase
MAVAAVALGTVGLALAPLALAQNPNAPAKGKAARAKAKTTRKAPPNAADPLVAKANEAADEKDKEKEKDREKAVGSFHYKLKIQAPDDTDLAASYYPGKPDTATPVVLLVHEKGRSSKDFEDAVTELKGKGLAEHLQGLGYAVLAFDLRGHGSNVRKALSERDRQGMVVDLQSAYLFLLDRHNRGELNLARLGVVGLGEGANLAAAWAYLPGGAVSHEGRVSDIAALVLASPLPNGEGFAFPTLMNSIAPRFPVLLMAGERDGPSHDVVKRVRAQVERTRQNRVELFPSSLHGYKLLRLEPRATAVIERFLEATIKLKAAEWEPRYNLQPVTYTDIQVIRHKTTDADKAKEKEKEKEKEKAKDEAKEKEKAKDQAPGDEKAKGEAPKAKG